MIFVDTGPLVALCDRWDSLHKRAVRQLATLSSLTFGTCEGVIAEACFHLPLRNQRLRLRALLERLDVAVLPVTADRELNDAVWNWLAKYHEHEPDWSDACLAALCGRDDSVVWSYDAEFRTTWRRPNGRPIRLAFASGNWRV